MIGFSFQILVSWQKISYSLIITSKATRKQGFVFTSGGRHVMNIDFAVSHVVGSHRHQMVLPHFDAVGKSDDTEMILGSEVVENREQGILGLNQHRSKTDHS